jgi:hypothetical protein
MTFKDIICAGIGMIHIEANAAIRNTVFLSGVARGGTTWISEIINHKNDYRYMFEPFYPRYVKLFKEFRYNQYIRPGENNPPAVQNARRVLTGRIRHYWIDRFNRTFISEKRLIKDVRANLLLKWLKELFPEIHLILLLRHPFAVAYSRMRLGWKDALPALINQPDLVDDFLSPFMPEISKCHDDFERQVCMWCIQHYVPLKQFQDTRDLYLVFYEKFCIDPVREARSLFRWLNQDHTQLSETHITRPSRMTKNHSAILSGKSLLTPWMNAINDAQITRGMELLNMFSLETVYGEGPMPNPHIS